MSENKRSRLRPLNGDAQAVSDQQRTGGYMRGGQSRPAGTLGGGTPAGGGAGTDMAHYPVHHECTVADSHRPVRIVGALHAGTDQGPGWRARHHPAHVLAPVEKRW